MLVVYRNTQSVNWSDGMQVDAPAYYGDAVVTFDPSKTNMAMVVGTPLGDIIDTVEFSGNNRKRGPVMDTTVYCHQVRSFLKSYLKNMRLAFVATEQAITKQGVNYHHSNMVLTEIRSNILNFFLEEYKIKVLEINNWAWKHAQLPEGFRGQHQKGSKLFFQKFLPDNPLAHYFEADMTDCYFIYRYVIDKNCNGYALFCSQPEQCNVEYTFAVYQDDMDFSNNMREVTYNQVFRVKDNLDYYVNRIPTVFFMRVPVKNLELDTIYGNVGFFSESALEDEYVKVVCTRK